MRILTRVVAWHGYDTVKGAESPINHLRITKESLKNHQRFTSAFQVNNALAYKEIS